MLILLYDSLCYRLRYLYFLILFETDISIDTMDGQPTKLEFVFEQTFEQMLVSVRDLLSISRTV